MPGPRISAIVVNHRRGPMTRACLLALIRALDALAQPAEIVAVDNGSSDDSCDVIRRTAPDATLLELPKNVGFAAAAAEGVRRSSGDWVLLVNNDVVVEPDAVAELLAVGESALDVGSVAAQMRFASDPGVINSAGIEVDRLGIAYDRLLGEPASEAESEPVEVFGASGGAALHRRRMLDEVGGIDEAYFFALEDVDLAWRARMRGWRCLHAPAAVVHHHHGATGSHGSELKYFHVGLNRVRTVAKNADRGLLLRYGLGMVAYDLAYVTFAGVADRTLAPLRGRLRGLREWRRFRGAGNGRGPVDLAPVRGLRAALERRSVWARHSSGSERAAPADHGREGLAEDLDVLAE